MDDTSQLQAIKHKSNQSDDANNSQGTDTHTNEEHPHKRIHSSVDGSDGLRNVQDIIPPAYLDFFLAQSLKDSSQRYLMLNNFVGLVQKDAKWSQVLDPKFLHITYCLTALESSKGLSDLVNECIRIKDFQKLFDSQFLRIPHPASPPQPREVDERDMEFFRDAFETEYLSPQPRILLKTIDQYKRSSYEDRYNSSFPIIQSSGLGKSRLVDYSATLRFTIPFNLHEPTDKNAKGYPPADHAVGLYLSARLDTAEAAKIRHMAFLEALFVEVTAKLEDYKANTREGIASQWYQWMKEGATTGSNGTNRSQLYEKVLAKAQELEKSGQSSDRKKHLNEASGALVGKLHRLYNETDDVSKSEGFHAIVYLDEAHVLQSTSISDDTTSYVSFMRAIKAIDDKSIFFIFLSTNSSLQLFAPTKAQHPSLRVRTESDLNQPFFELPFDIFSRRFSSEAREAGKLTLSGVCELGQMSKFGRPMWYSHYKSIPPSSAKNPHNTLTLARLKLKGYLFKQDDSPESMRVKLAALGCRILLPFDQFNINSRNIQADLVESYMRCVFYIPPTREYMWSGYPSEPILSQAAAQLLNEHPKPIIDHAPEIVAHAFRNNLLARGERGELVAQLFLMIAHDLTIQKQNTTTSSSHLPYHSPISLPLFLQNLFSPEIWDEARKARPFHAHPGDPDLETAFKGTWLSFSHVVELGDHESLNFKTLVAVIKRGGAIKTSVNEEYIDLLIPVFFGDPNKTEITEDCISFILIQVQNRNKARRVHMDSPLLEKVPGNCYVLSIVMELGVANFDQTPDACARVTIRSTNKGGNAPAGHTRSQNTAVGIERRHYIITTYGCTSQTYRCVPEGSEVYRSLLAAQKPLDGFPRSENHEMLYEMKPKIYNSDLLSNLSWEN